MGREVRRVRISGRFTFKTREEMRNYLVLFKSMVPDVTARLYVPGRLEVEAQLTDSDMYGDEEAWIEYWLEIRAPEGSEWKVEAFDTDDDDGSASMPAFPVVPRPAPSKRLVDPMPDSEEPDSENRPGRIEPLSEM